MEERRSRWSSEVRVLLGPAAAFRELRQDQRAGPWVLLRRPLLLAFAMGCTVSLQASGRLSARLIVDGAVSFAFVPVFELAALVAVYRRRPRGMPFARAADLLFTANAPWLVWLIAFDALRCLQSPAQATAPSVPLTWILAASLILTAVWSAYIDLHFFRDVLPRPAGSAVPDLILQRAIGWSCGLVYFLGYAIWAEIVGRIAA